MAVNKQIKRLSAALALVCTAIAAPLANAADIQIYPTDDAGVGFNDATAVTPVGGNTGTTLGQQRANVFLAVANIWGKRLQSNVPIKVLASFGPLRCAKDEGILGSAGPANVYSDFPSAPRTGTLYPSALANKLAGVQLSTSPDVFSNADIITTFNGNLGKPGCLENLRFYLGLDGKPPAGQIDLQQVVAHEFAHGLGFLTFTDGEFGVQQNGIPSIWDYFLFDVNLKKTWAEMSVTERPQSAVGWRNLVWTGRNVQAATSRTLRRGVPNLQVFTNGKTYQVELALSGPQINANTYAVGPFAVVADQPDGKQGCAPLNAKNAAAVWSKIVVLDADGACNFLSKVKNVQKAGAAAVIGAATITLSGGVPLPVYLLGNDPEIKIPLVGITKTGADEIKAEIAATASRPALRAWGALSLNPAKLNGADDARRAYMYTSSDYRPGSSVSHYDTSADPHLLMEPTYDGTLPGIPTLSAPQDLTLELLKDIGW